jgi:murein DD-endopeptidase MepM/ murein hydrolase activator NlpD
MTVLSNIPSIDEVIRPSRPEEIENVSILKSEPNLKEGEYRIPVRVNSTGKILDNDNNATIIGAWVEPGPYLNPIHGTGGHQGLDLAAPKGTPIYAPGPGIVISTTTENENTKGGLSVTIKHEPQDPTLISYMAHCDSINCSVGQKVDSNTVIATVGNTGNAKGGPPHCHFGFKEKNQFVDPKKILGKPYGYTQNKLSTQIFQIAKVAKLFLKLSKL